MKRKGKKKRFYAPACMLAILVLAAILTAGGFLLRRTVLKGLPQYDGAQDIAVPLMLLQDGGPLREARERAAWEAAQQSPHRPAAAESAAETPEPSPEPPPEATPEPTPLPPAETPEAEDGVIVLEPEPEGAEEDELVVVGGEETAGEPPAAPEETPEPTPEAEENEPVPESYFDNTLFIGDSKTDEMRNWVRLGKARYFCDTNFSVYNIFDKTASDEDFRNVKLDWVLRHWKYDQVYIMLGYNECGYPYESLMEQFDYVVRRVRDAQPKARIILHGVMHANESVSGMYACYAPDNLERVNDGLRALAESYENTYYVDCNGPFCDENGYLYNHVSLDGEHLLPDYSRLWAEEIRRRAIVD